MDQLNSDRKLALENKHGMKICPFTVEGTEEMIMGMLAGETPVNVYRCGVNGGNALGGLERSAIPQLLGPDCSITPCSAQFADTCPTYLGALRYKTNIRKKS